MEKKMKKAAAIVLVLILALTAVGCGSGKTKDGNSEASADKTGIRKFEGTTLYMIAEQQTPTVALKDQLDSFEDLTGIKVDLQMAPFDDVVQKETLAFESKSGAYDVLAAPYQFLGNMAENKYIQPLEPLMEDTSINIIEDFHKDDIIEGMWKASGEWKGTYYGVPANSCIDIFMYRKDLFENKEEQAAFKKKYGYDLVVPKDWDSYMDIAEFFTRKKGEKLMGQPLDGNFYGVSMAGKRHDATTCEWMNYMWSFGGGIFDKGGNIAVNSEKSVAALEYYKELSKYAPDGVTSKTWDEVTTELQQGISAMSILFNDCAPALEDPSASTVVGKMWYGAIPVGEVPAAHYGAWGYYIPSDAPNPEAAWVFLQWFNTPEVQKNIALAGGFVNLKSIYDDPELNKLPYWEASKEAYKISTSRPRIPQWNEMNNVLMLELSNTLAGKTDPKTALDNTAAEFEKILSGSLPVTYQ
ncbi:MAG: ABC transporter substrate-binding protein [Blautia sp.]|jgi:multiple sugar transport system substrate-binding protein